jgi:uncharacterized protein YbjQ (UPF0145 family)
MDELHSLFATRGQGNVKQHYARARGPEGAMIVTTTNDVTGYRVTQHLGVVRGLTVRSRSIIGNIGAGIQSLFGGNITIYTELAERAREDAFNLMVEHAASAGANAVIAMRYDANEIMQGVTEVLAYGTAVMVERNV